MASFDPINLTVLVLAVGGLVAVLAELLVKDPRGLFEMMSDSRRFAACSSMASRLLRRPRRA